MSPEDTEDTVNYPQTPEEWRMWIETELDINQEQGIRLVERGDFPLASLIEIWKQEFSIEQGYSPHFIPALTRNKIGFLKWVYCNGPEPNWTKSDEQQE